MTATMTSIIRMFGMSVSSRRRLSGATYSVEQVPENYHEHFILRGYRPPRSSFSQCLLSVFELTNETLNVWTHFLPALYFAWIIAHLSGHLDFLSDTHTWPLLCYLSVCCVFPLTSAVAHLFNVLSDHARQVCFFLDYSALAMFSLGVAVAYRAYCFPGSLLAATGGVAAWYRDNYVPLAALNAVACTLTSCQTRFMPQSPLRRLLRLSAFAFTWIFDSLPILYRAFFEVSDDVSVSLYLFRRSALFAFLSAFLYASHFPERLLPGMFDIVGHSHQLFHVTSILAVWDQLQAVLVDFETRRKANVRQHWHLDNVRQHWHFSHTNSSVKFVGAIFLINVLIVVLFTFKLYRIRRKNKSN